MRKGGSIPHSLMLYGEPWTIRWGNPKDKDWDPVENLGMADQTTNTITLHPEVRGDLQRSWEVLIHEILHIANWYEKDHRKENEQALRPKDEYITQFKWYNLKHGDIYSMSMVFGRLMAQNRVSFACACNACFKRRELEDAEDNF